MMPDQTTIDPKPISVQKSTRSHRWLRCGVFENSAHTPEPRVDNRLPQAGVTLVEILVVLSIIAITTGAVMLRLGMGRSDDALTSAAQTLTLALTTAAADVMATGEDRVLDFGPQGFALHPASAPVVWTPLPDLSLSRSDALPDALRLSADATSAPFNLILTQGNRSVTVAFDGLTATDGPVNP